MQTFLPYSCFLKSLTCLDNKRLGKQRVESFQILCALGHVQALEERAKRNPNAKPYKGWKNHPATLMWRGYEEALVSYYNDSVLIWKDRGFNNTMPALDFDGMNRFPHWLGSDDFHMSHRSNLLRKDPKHYRKYFGLMRDDLSYVWPKGAY